MNANESELAARLRKIRFLADLPEGDLQSLARISRLESYPAGTVLFRENDTANEVYLVTSGKVSVIMCRPHTGCRQIMVADHDAMLGWSCLVPRTRLSATARTVEPVEAVVIDGEKLEQLCGSHPKLGYEFMKRTAEVLSDRLNATRMQLLDAGAPGLLEVVLESD